MTQVLPPRAVFDCNIYFQALISPQGPAACCLISAARGEVLLFCSEQTLIEFRDVSGRPTLKLRFRLTDERVEQIVETVRESAAFIDRVPDIYRHPIDPDDSHYVNLAAVCNAKLLVSRDDHLLRLMDPGRPEGQDFRRRFPAIEIIQPEALLHELAVARQRRHTGE